jgi:hypothetical protein
MGKKILFEEQLDHQSHLIHESPEGGVARSLILISKISCPLSI